MRLGWGTRLLHLRIESAIQKPQSSYVPVQTENIVADLDIPNMAKKFNCVTEIGHWYLKESLSNPLKVRSELISKRNAAINLLEKEQDLRDEVKKVLEEAIVHEKTAMMLLSEFFKGSACPELKKLEESKGSVQYPLSAFITKHPLSTSLASLYHGTLGVLGYGTLGTTVFMNLKTLATLSVGAAFYTNSFYGIFLAGMGSYKFYKDYTSSAEKRSKIHALHRLLRLSEHLEKLSREKGFMLQHPLSQATNKENVSLMNKIRSSRYAYANSYIFAVPLVHSFLYQLYEKEQHLAALFASIAEMDAYYAIATKMIENKDKAARLCHVNYFESRLPSIQAKGLWYLLVEDPVINDFDETNNIILTGPNAGGKSTFIRSIVQNIVLAQTYGVAAAQEFAFTPFDVIHMFLNIKDDPIRKKSRYLVELEVAGEIIAVEKKLQMNEKYFWTTDELFSGTGEAAGGRVAYQFIKERAQSVHYDSEMFMFATHFKVVTELENDMVLRCKNYKVNPPVNGIYPYTISPGINMSEIAYEVAKQKGVVAQ